MFLSLDVLVGVSSSWRRWLNDLWFLCTPVVCTGAVELEPLSRSVRPPSALSELSAPRAPVLLRSCARGMAEARGLLADEPALPPEVLPSRFAFCSSTLRGRDRNVVKG